MILGADGRRSAVPGGSVVAASLPAPQSRPLVLADLVPAVRARNALLVAAGVLFTALLAQVSVPVPGSPVPITGQTLAVVLTAAALGPLRGTAGPGAHTLTPPVRLSLFSPPRGGYRLLCGGRGGRTVG